MPVFIGSTFLIRVCSKLWLIFLFKENTNNSNGGGGGLGLGLGDLVWNQNSAEFNLRVEFVKPRIYCIDLEINLPVPVEKPGSHMGGSSTFCTAITNV